MPSLFFTIQRMDCIGDFFCRMFSPFSMSELLKRDNQVYHGGPRVVEADMIWLYSI